MSDPALVIYPDEADYRSHFDLQYCKSVIHSFDGIRIYFRQNKFGHCFYESSRRDENKDVFSRTRAERIDWIKANLEDPSAEIYQGWNKDKKVHDPTRRVSVTFGNYVVIIVVKEKAKTADFMTAYVADNSIEKIREGPKW